MSTSNMVIFAIGGIVSLAALVGFFAAFWGKQPKADNSSRSDFGTLTGGGNQIDNGHSHH
jgi:hypothetical protein